jgi:hypothetical protein
MKRKESLKSLPNFDQRVYWIWSTMIQRCENPSSQGYRIYGARGITVCERWRHSFAAFASDMGPKPDGTSIERNDPSGGYVPMGNTERAKQEPPVLVSLRLRSR